MTVRLPKSDHESVAPPPLAAAAASPTVPSDLSTLLVKAAPPPFSGHCREAASSNPTLINSAITAAGMTTSSSLNFLVHMAILESRLESFAQAGTSTASGLFQFTDQTWLALVKRHGARYGLKVYADAIIKDHGQWVVLGRNMRQRILALRQDPTLSAIMAAEFAKENAAIMRQTLGRAPTDGELYVAHFLGARDAVKLINARTTMPGHESTALFPAAARSNPWIFRKPDGEPRSVAELYDLLTRGPSPEEIAMFCRKGYQPAQLAAGS